MAAGRAAGVPGIVCGHAAGRGPHRVEPCADQHAPLVTNLIGAFTALPADPHCQVPECVQLGRGRLQ